MPTKTKDDSVPLRLGSLAIAAWGLVLVGGCRAIEIFLEAQSMTAAVGQAVLVEWGVSRVGVAWTEGAPRTIARRIAIGAATGLALAGVLLAVLSIRHAVSLVPTASVEVSVLVVGFLTAALSAWRDELLLHGLTLRVIDRSFSDVGKVLACGATSAGAALGRADDSPRTVFVAAILGVILGAFWVRDRGAWQPWALHTSLHFATRTLLAGGVVDGRIADGPWAGGSHGILGGTAAAIALAPLAVLALLWTARRSSPRSALVG